MFELSLPITAAWANAAIFGAAGLINLGAIRACGSLRGPGHPRRLCRTLGLIEVAAAVFLARRN
jgi:hypothetical protein